MCHEKAVQVIISIMRTMSNVAKIATLCLVVAVFAASPSHQGKVKVRSAAKVAPPTDARVAADFINLSTHIAHKEALDFAVESLGNITGNVNFEDKIVIGLSVWFILREDVDSTKFKQAYSHHVREKCTQLEFPETKQQRTTARDQSQLNLKLSACEILLGKRVESKVKAAATGSKCNDKLKYRTSGISAIFGYILGAAITCIMSL